MRNHFSKKNVKLPGQFMPIELPTDNYKTPKSPLFINGHNNLISHQNANCKNRQVVIFFNPGKKKAYGITADKLSGKKIKNQLLL